MEGWMAGWMEGRICNNWKEGRKEVEGRTEAMEGFVTKRKK